MLKGLSKLEEKYDWFAYCQGALALSGVVLLQTTIKSIALWVPMVYAIHFRSAFLLLVNTIVVVKSGENLSIANPKILGTALARGILSSIAFILLMFSVKYLPIAIAFSLYKSFFRKIFCIKLFLALYFLIDKHNIE